MPATKVRGRGGVRQGSGGEPRSRVRAGTCVLKATVCFLQGVPKQKTRMRSRNRLEPRHPDSGSRRYSYILTTTPNTHPRWFLKALGWLGNQLSGSSWNEHLQRVHEFPPVTPDPSLRVALFSSFAKHFRKDFRLSAFIRRGLKSYF